jgi:hypothetical protein
VGLILSPPLSHELPLVRLCGADAGEPPPPPPLRRPRATAGPRVQVRPEPLAPLARGAQRGQKDAPAAIAVVALRPCVYLYIYICIDI